MSGKYLIFGATGSIGSNLSKMMAENNEDVQLIGCLLYTSPSPRDGW